MKLNKKLVLPLAAVLLLPAMFSCGGSKENGEGGGGDEPTVYKLMLDETTYPNNVYTYFGGVNFKIYFGDSADEEHGLSIDLDKGSSTYQITLFITADKDFSTYSEGMNGFFFQDIKMGGEFLGLSQFNLNKISIDTTNKNAKYSGVLDLTSISNITDNIIVNTVGFSSNSI